MSNEVMPLFSFDGADDYSMYAGGAHDLLEQEGFYAVAIESGTPEKAKNGLSAMVKLALKIGDADASGASLIARPHYFGKDKNGKTMARQFFDVLVSAGVYTEEQIKQLGAAKQQVDINQFIAGIIGRTAYIEYKFAEYQGELKGEVANFISKQRYEEAAKEFAEKKACKRFRGRTQTDPSVLALLEKAAKATAAGPIVPVQNGGGFSLPGLQLPTGFAAPAPVKL